MVYYSFIFFSLSSISLLSSFSLYFSINGNHIFIALAGVAGLLSNKIWWIIMIAMVTLMRIIKVFKVIQVIRVIIVMIGMIKELFTYYYVMTCWEHFAHWLVMKRIFEYPNPIRLFLMHSNPTFLVKYIIWIRLFLIFG